MRLHSTLFLLLMTLLPALLVPQTEQVPTGVVAKAGNVFVTEKEFIERFELSPALHRGRKSRLEDAKLELLYSIIAEKLLAQEARERGLDRDSAFQSSFDVLRKILARDQLYREEVSSKVDVSEREVLQAIAEAQREILISFIYFQSKDAALFLRNQMKSNADFAAMQIDSSLGATRDTATVIWGDAEPPIERAAYRLQNREISPVIAAGSGYYILRVEGTKRNAFYASLAPSVLKEKILSKLRERKEQTRLDQFVREVLNNRVGYSRSQPLRILSRALEQVFAASTSAAPTALSQAMAAEVRQRCRTILADTLAVAGSVVWSTDEIIVRLQEKGFSVDSAGLGNLAQRVNLQLKIWVQQELLEQEALARRLDQSLVVQRQLDMWQQSMMAQQMMAYLKKQVNVSESEVWAAIYYVDSSIVIPRVHVRELRTSTPDEMQQALRDLDRGESMVTVIHRWCRDSSLRVLNGISPPFPVSERYPVGELAWQMDIGQRYGPVREGSDFIYFELLSKDSLGARRDTSVANARRTALSEVRRQKEKRLIDLFLAQVSSSRGFMIYQDRLMRLAVTPIPMMTFRILGFGGRMFAVPFVDRLIDWINIEPPSGQIVF